MEWLEGEDFFESFKDTRSSKSRVGGRGKGISMTGKSYSYKARQKIEYSIEKRAMQREESLRTAVAVEIIPEEPDKKNGQRKKNRTKERKRPVVQQPFKTRLTKHDKEKIRSSQKKNGFYKFKEPDESLK